MFSTLIMFYICAKKANILDAQCYFKISNISHHLVTWYLGVKTK